MTPRSIEAAILVAIVLLAAAGGWMLNGWRLGGQLEHARGERDAALTQGQVLARAVETCSAGVEQAKLSGAAAIASGRALLAEARRLHAPDALVATKLEQLLARPAPAGAGCDEAWQEIEKAGAAR